jgi:hypothetical protein
MTAPTPEHPSDLQLDALHLGELPAAREASVRDHLSGCVYCAERMRLRSPAAFAELDPDRIVNRLVESVPVRQPWFSLVRSRRLLVPMTACAAAVVLLIVVSGRPRPAGTGSERAAEVESVRAKGGHIALRVFRDERGGVESRSGGAFRAGDRIRFRVDMGETDALPYIAILGVEASAKRSVYYPAFAADGPAPVSRTEVRAGDALPGAIELDDYTGDEWLYAVACPHPFAPTDVVVNAPGQEPRIPDACRWHSFRLVKK